MDGCGTGSAWDAGGRVGLVNGVSMIALFDNSCIVVWLTGDV